MSGAGFGIPDGSGGFVSKLESDGDAKIGDSSGDLIQITGSVAQLGTTFQITTTRNNPVLRRGRMQMFVKTFFMKQL